VPSILPVLLSLMIVCSASLMCFSDVYFHENIYRVMHEDASSLEVAPDVLFLGDSSLGNAVNLEVVRDELDAKSFPLAGLYGAAGALGLYHGIVDRENVRHIFLVFSFDFFTREFSYFGAFKTWSYSIFLQTAVDYVQIFNRSINLSERLNLLLSRLLNDGFTYPKDEQNLIRHHGYYPQSALDGKLEPRTAYTAADINEEKIEELKLFLDALPSDVNVTFAFGPYFKEPIVKSSSYVEEVRRLLSDLNVNYVEAFEMEDTMVGDSSFHIAPEFRSLSTRYYLSQLASTN
jgi:hypothetical protein